jgi:hypothetical protein
MQSMSVSEFLKGKEWNDRKVPINPIPIFLTLSLPFLHPEIASAATTQGAISKAFDAKIWPLMLDLGEPLAKSMMAIGIYRCIRNDMDKGWKQFYRAGLGLCGLYLIDGAIKIISGVGTDLNA